MRLRDAIKNVLLEAKEAEEAEEKEDEEENEKETKGKKKMEEAVVSGGGATGAAMVPDPTTKRAVAPGKSDQNNGMPLQKLTTDGVTSTEDTDEENNTKADGNAAGNLASIKPKGGSMKEHVDVMFDGEELSEEFKEKAATIFEAAVNLRVNEITEELESMYEARLNEKLEEIEAQTAEDIQELTNKIDQYINYVVEEWLKENEVAVETSLRSEITEEFIEGLKNLFSEHYIEIPEEKVNVVEELAGRVEELEARLNDSINENIELRNSINEMASEEIFNEVSEGLTISQVEKLKKLAEGVDFDDADNFKKKLSIVKENYFPSSSKKKGANLLEESFEGEEPAAVTSGGMSEYVRAISRTTIR